MGSQEVKFSTVKAYALENGIESAVQKFGEKYRAKLNEELTSSLSGPQGDNVDEYVPSNKEKGFMEQLWPGKPWAERTPLGKAARWVMTVGILPVLSLGGLSSCEKFEADAPRMEIKIQISSEVKVQIINNSVDALLGMGYTLTELKNLVEQLLLEQKKTNDNLDELGSNLNDKLTDINNRLDFLIDTVVDLKVKGEQLGNIIIKLLEDNNNSLGDIIAVLKDQGYQLSTIIELLKAQGVKMDDLMKAMQKNNISMDEIFKLLSVIIGQNAEEIKLNEQNKEMWKRLLEAIDKVNLNIENLGTDVKAKFDDLTSLVYQFMRQEASFNEEEKALGQKILDAVNKLNFGSPTVNVDLSKLEAMMSILVEKAGKLDANTKAILEAVLDGKKDFGKALDEIKDLIIKNNNIAQGTQDLVAKLGDKLDGLGDDIKAILLKILDEEQIQNVTSEELLKVLKAIKNDTAENGKTLLRIEDKLNLVAQSVNVLIETTENMHEGTKALLIQILDKIPAACDCNIDEVIVKLEEIITVIKEKPSDNNEGIVDDLDDLLK